jgi:2-dehydro-3-deoxyglucarate aldolase
MKNLREALKNKQTVVGTWLNSGSPIIAELLAAVGFDYVCVDAEHSAVDIPQTQALFQAIASGNPACAPIVRLHGVDYALVKRYLDAGARGVVAPLVRTRAEAELLVQACKYPPIGLRGVGFCRANDYGMRLASEFERANEEILVAVQIEHIAAVENIDEILSVDGIDAVFIGPYDLSASMGLTGQFEHPKYIDARDRILEACGNHNVVPGLHVVPTDPQQVIDRHAEGYRFIAYSLDITMITTACQQGLKEIRKAIPS